MKYFVTYLFLMTLSVFEMKAEVDPKFQIYLCFGQSNMEGGLPPDAIDMYDVGNRFQTLATKDFSSPNRIMGNWYTANTPIISDKNTISPVDYFGRSMIAALPVGYKVGVVCVAIGGADIRAFMSDKVQDYINAPYYFEQYGNDPYRRLVEMAKMAKNVGVIKGILLHQGEKNCGDPEWPQWVKTIYDSLISDLELNAAEVPLLVGEVVNATENGECAVHNNVIAQVPSVIPTAHVISSYGCPCSADRLHFSALGYRILGKRYAIKMLELLGYPAHKDANYSMSEWPKLFYKATLLDTQDDVTLLPNETYEIQVTAHFEDGHQENVTAQAVVTCTGKGVTVSGNTLKSVTGKRSLVTVSYTDFTGQMVSTSFYVNPSNPIIGDVNGDDVLDEKDLKAMINHIMGKPQEGTFDVNMANFNKDDKVDAVDVVYLINLMRQNQ